MTRPAIFISHANPEDNEFTIWLGAHLSAAGYEVWADVLRLRGGEDWARKLENALRERACKVLLVGTPWGVDKQGVRNEIQIASEVSKKIGDNAFVIPLRLQKYDSPFQIVQAQYIDFMNGWGQGLAELLGTLDSYQVPRLHSFNTESISNWRAVQLVKARAVERTPENLISNWVRISEWPNSIRYFEFRGAVGEDQAKALVAHCKWPTFSHGRGFFTFTGKADFQLDDGTSLPISLEKEWWVPHFLENGDQERSIGSKDSRNVVSHLTKCALEKMFQDSNLSQYEFASGILGWWVSSGLIPDDKVAFKWEGGPSGRRHLAGEVTVGRSKYRWHFGVSGKPWISTNPYVCILPRILFSQDGFSALDDVRYMHRLRRSVPKSWRNERWRDMLLAFLFWLSKGERYLLLETGSSSRIKLEIPPISMTCPVSIKHEAAEVVEEIDTEADDPVFAVGLDEFDEDQQEIEHEAPPEGSEQPQDGEE